MAETASPARGGLRRALLGLRLAWYAPTLLGTVVMGRGAAQREALRADTARWRQVVDLQVASGVTLLALIATYREFRTLYYYRLKRSGVAGAAVSAVFATIYPGERTLHLACSSIGGGLFIQHGFATIVAARSVGENCWINQQVTIGFDRPGARPVIGNNVSIHAGAKVLGEITVGDGARVGANAVVVNDVPAGYTAVGVPATMLPPKSQR